MQLYTDRLETYKTGLVENALSLILEHNVPHADVVKWITEALLERVHLQKIPVAINECHGGFSLSNHFQQFMNTLYTGRSYRTVVEDFLKRPLKDTEAVAVEQYCYRVSVALAIPLYGQHICEEYPDIAIMYSKKGISKLLHVALMIEKERKRIANIHQNLSAIHALNNPKHHFSHGEEEDTTYEPYVSMIMENDENVEHYATCNRHMKLSYCFTSAMSLLYICFASVVHLSSLEDCVRDLLHPILSIGRTG